MIVAISGFVIFFVGVIVFVGYRRNSNRRMHRTGHIVNRNGSNGKIPPPRAFTTYQDNIAPAGGDDDGSIVFADAHSTTPQMGEEGRKHVMDDVIII